MNHTMNEIKCDASGIKFINDNSRAESTALARDVALAKMHKSSGLKKAAFYRRMYDLKCTLAPSTLVTGLLNGEVYLKLSEYGFTTLPENACQLRRFRASIVYTKYIQAWKQLVEERRKTGDELSGLLSRIDDIVDELYLIDHSDYDDTSEPPQKKIKVLHFSKTLLSNVL